MIFLRMIQNKGVINTAGPVIAQERVFTLFMRTFGACNVCMGTDLPYDFVVIGGGSAGYAAARTAASLGLRTAIIEGGGQVGGLCILSGCMPSKTLIESANRLRDAQNTAAFGLQIRQASADIPAIIARKRTLIGEFADYRRDQLEEGPFDFFRGLAAFEDPHRVRVNLLDGNTVILESSRFLIATGSRNGNPGVPGLDTVNAITSDEILDSRDLPPSVIVLGAGPVALEMAHYMQAMGSRITIIQRSPQFLRSVDSDVASVVEGAFRDRGMAIFTGTRLQNVERSGGEVLVRFETASGPAEARAAAVFNALGRKPALEKLGLERAGIRSEKGRIVALPTMQTSQPHIFAAGDCCSPYEVVHIAIQQGELAARNAVRLGKNLPLESMDYRLKLFAVFTEPEIATVGLTETEARTAGIPCRTATYDFRDHGKSMIMGATRGFVKLLADPQSGELLGGAVVGPHASDLIHEIVVAMAFHATAAQLAAIPHYHPTLGEIWTYPAEELAETRNPEETLGESEPMKDIASKIS